MNPFNLFVKIGIKDEASESVDKIKASTIAAGQLMADAAKTATRALVNLGRQAIDGYAETEQLRGGVETLFKTSADTVMAYADNAYKTAGMSANEYMNTVTSFSASLLQSLGGDTEAAAEKANLAITDMADNANKMGTDMQSIQNAYQGFAKGNMTMLDNLKLGYGGTQEEMKRLLADAQAISGIEYDISSYADIVDAIHTVQTEMGITGTTAAEAASTISGSAAAMKAAWTNLVAGLADENANVDQLLLNFIDSVKTTAGNVIPVVGNVLTSIGKLLEEKGPEMVVNGALLLGKLAVGAVQATPEIIGKIPEIVAAIVEGFQENGPEFLEIGKAIVQGIWEGIKSMGSWIEEKASGFVGGIVDNVKGVLGIHSPSRVFAGIGKNMALGLEEGWSGQYDRIGRGIESELRFDTTSVNFASSGLGVSSAGVVNGLSAAAGDTGNQGAWTLNLMLPDGTKLASYLFGPLADYGRANGTPILNPM